MSEPQLRRAKELCNRLRQRVARSEEKSQPTAPSKSAHPVHTVLHRILLFSLARQNARRQQFLEHLQRFPGLVSRVEWLSAVDGSSLNLHEVPEEVVDSDGIKDALTCHSRVLGYVLTRGAIGLAWTWFRALEMICQDEEKRHVYLICEDDARFSPNFPSLFHDLCSAAECHDPDWEVLHVGYHPACTTVTSCGRRSCQDPASCLLGRPTQLFGAYAVAIRPDGAQKLWQKMFPVNLQVDTELSRVYQNLGKATGTLQARVQRQEPQDPSGALKVFAPRPVSEAEVQAFPLWTGPLVVAPASRAGSTDIQVLDSENWNMQYGSIADGKNKLCMTIMYTVVYNGIITYANNM